jgi:hypothetical protein
MPILPGKGRELHPAIDAGRWAQGLDEEMLHSHLDVAHLPACRALGPMPGKFGREEVSGVEPGLVPFLKLLAVHSDSLS